MHRVVRVRSSNGREARGRKRNGANHRKAARDEGRYENRLAFRAFREGDERRRRLGGAVDQDELVPEYGGSEVGGLWRDFGQREPVQQYPRGPKGYVRSDERIREDICDELMQMTDLDSSDVDVAVREGEVVLAGTVPDRSMKYRIEQIADRCAGVVEIANQIRVRKR